MIRSALWLGQLWCLPVTLAGALVAWAGGARLTGRHRGAWVFTSRGGLTARFFIRFNVSAFTWGAVICKRADLRLSEAGLRRLLEHERRHFIQACWLGPLMPLAYGACSLVAVMRGRHPYFDNWLERDARAWEDRA